MLNSVLPADTPKTAKRPAVVTNSRRRFSLAISPATQTPKAWWHYPPAYSFLAKIMDSGKQKLFHLSAESGVLVHQKTSNLLPVCKHMSSVVSIRACCLPVSAVSGASASIHAETVRCPTCLINHSWLETPFTSISHTLSACSA